ncbi:MAG: UDP-N-acetylmuramoyl-tripeptide--D-alanyl-D-alanine ligase [Alphaproteobacteria bacterium]|nr:UDP-N-acetylmuramoyl-tripeptide--D-alanyl-D-alanine ligase [Alphaproteobacteria bacterium]
MNITLNKIASILGSDIKTSDIKIKNISTDSRTIEKGDLFIAVKGEKFDGHSYVKDVINKGAVAAVVEHYIDDISKDKQILAADSLDAYGKIGSYIRDQFKGTLIGLTGSAGKTTTKEEIKFILSHFGKVYATSGNHNNFVGVPESLCKMDLSADFAVIEMGMSAKGEISRLTSYVKPDIALITNVYPMHIEFFPDLEHIALAKAEIFEGLKKGGTAVINADTNYADILIEQAKKKTNKILLFGKNNQPKADFELQDEGEHHFYNAWATLKIIEALNLNVQKAASFIKDFGALDGRGKKHTLKLKKGGTYTLIDDSYSGQPEAMKLAISALDKMSSKGRKIAVLGKMAELGSHSKEKHIEIGQALAKTNIDIVVGVCEEMKDMLACLPKHIKQYYFESKDGLDEFLLKDLLQNEDILLIKGARYSSRLYQITEELIKKGS